MKTPDMTELEAVSSLDGSREKSLFWLPPGARNVPLLVGLHTWSADRFNQVNDMLPFCRERGWGLLLPEFRGPNLTSNPRAPQACASQLAKQDILDALAQVLKSQPLDAKQVFLLGGSGGGHMSLMMAAAAPKTWRAVSSWCPITDLSAWHGQNPKYAPHIAACCGGLPGGGEKIDLEYRQRSPLTHVEKLREACLSVHHGRHDPSVPCSHTWRLAMAMEEKPSKSFFFEIFDGAHELRCERAFHWFDSLLQSDQKTRGLTG
ncbi:MAG: prolyl oligopeptidase family serine peptidase [Verrucomicrobiae bacterium]|nr:prolyl oligopeptidase family serine peptidase [Verrucomicrobiae bacterium]